MRKLIFILLCMPVMAMGFPGQDDCSFGIYTGPFDSIVVDPSNNNHLVNYRAYSREINVVNKGWEDKLVLWVNYNASGDRNYWYTLAVQAADHWNKLLGDKIVIKKWDHSFAYSDARPYTVAPNGDGRNVLYVVHAYHPMVNDPDLPETDTPVRARFFKPFEPLSQTRITPVGTSVPMARRRNEYITLKYTPSNEYAQEADIFIENTHTGWRVERPNTRAEDLFLLMHNMGLALGLGHQDIGSVVEQVIIITRKGLMGSNMLRSIYGMARDMWDVTMIKDLFMTPFGLVYWTADDVHLVGRNAYSKNETSWYNFMGRDEVIRHPLVTVGVQDLMEWLVRPTPADARQAACIYPLSEYGQALGGFDSLADAYWGGVFQ